ncbi:hypothetical protein AAFF_G00027330, partial [Aldrovandia affinis]
MSLDSVEGISPCAQPLASKVSSITMPTLVPTTPPISSHSWTHYMASSFQPSRGVDQSSPEFFSAWRWKVYDCHPLARMPLLQAMEDACGDIDVGAFGGWIRHARRFFPRCLARENIACDVDE